MCAYGARFVALGMIAATGLAVFGAMPAFAQLGGGGSDPTSGLQAASKRTLRANQQGGKGDTAPPVLPGTKRAVEAAAPTMSPADMSPTDGLFDAINRGDAAAARDAMNRGANLDGLNVLGLTPLELAVDLGRNDISFMLLSMRGDDPAVRRGARTGGDGDTSRRASAAPRAPSRARVMAASSAASDEAAAATPRLYSGGGGAPIPAAGFVGFGGGR